MYVLRNRTDGAIECLTREGQWAPCSRAAARFASLDEAKAKAVTVGGYACLVLPGEGEDGKTRSNLVRRRRGRIY